MAIKKVALIGANGRLGPAILSALLDSSFSVTVLTRASSKSSYPSTVAVRRVPDDADTAAYAHALAGQDAAIVSFAGSNDTLQISIADACVQAGVQRFIPADFGSCDSASARAVALIPLYGAKTRVREHLQALAARTSLSWTSLVCGHFFDYGLASGLLAVDLSARKAQLFDGGEIKWSTSTLATIGKATVRVLELEAQTRNRMLYIQSFAITQKQLLEAVERATGEKFEVEDVRSEDFMKHYRAEADKDPENGEFWEELVSVLGIVDADWTAKEDFANELLGLKGDDLDEIVKKVVSEK